MQLQEEESCLQQKLCLMSMERLYLDNGLSFRYLLCLYIRVLNCGRKSVVAVAIVDIVVVAMRIVVVVA